MTLILKPPPPEGLDLVRNALSDVMETTTAATDITSAEIDRLDVAAPHPVYATGLDDVVAGELLARTQLVGWRYLFLVGEQVRFAAEVSTRADDQLDFSNVNRGPFVANTVDAITVAESLPAVQQEDYELRLLKVPSLYLLALWLHGPEEIIIPVAPTLSELAPNAPYSERELLAILAPIAERRLSNEDSDLPTL